MTKLGIVPVYLNVKDAVNKIAGGATRAERAKQTCFIIAVPEHLK